MGKPLLMSKWKDCLFADVVGANLAATHGDPIAAPSPIGGTPQMSVQELIEHANGVAGTSTGRQGQALSLTAGLVLADTSLG